ncbi:unnamed protein product [Dracunculus medinensis]|uniref:Uncharacterized protein n=1 Tax=Dracunculus medinensis TaxID=318479 RepID=A0A0N4US46_DRAME|nr:unnamed protein product [Dracunculus medinensis]
MKQLKNDGILENLRPDYKADILTKRLNNFKMNTLPMLKDLDDQEKLKVIRIKKIFFKGVSEEIAPCSTSKISAKFQCFRIFLHKFHFWKDDNAEMEKILQEINAAIDEIIPKS